MNHPVEQETIKRIESMSSAFDRASKALQEAEKHPEVLGQVQVELEALDWYQQSGLWLKDFEADEAGLLPEGLPRSVLSEDGLYNLLQDAKALRDPDPYAVTLISDRTEDGIRKASFQTCPVVCSEQIDIETEGDIIRRVQYTKGCHGNTQGVSALCVGRKVDEVINLLEGINCKGRGTSCPDQLARALKQLR